MLAQLQPQRILSVVRLCDTLRFVSIETDWFIERIKESGYGSLRSLAPKIRGKLGKRLDVAALSLMLRGKREIKLGEARQLADLLMVPMGEVIRRAGVPFRGRDNVEGR